MTAAITVAMTATQLTDGELMRLMLGGDKESFAELYRRRQRNVYRFALQMTGTPDLAEDVTQEVFMLLMRDGCAYDEARGSVNAFLLGVTRNYVLRRLKQESFFVTMEDNVHDAPPRDQINASDTLLQGEAMQAMHRAVLNLPPHYREVVVLCELQELSYAEAAEVLGCAIGTVRSRLHRARGILMEKLGTARAETASTESLKSARCFA